MKRQPVDFRRPWCGKELARVLRRKCSSAAGRFVWLAGYLVLMVAGTGLSVTALATSPQLGGLVLMATLPTAVASLALRVAFDRRGENAADPDGGRTDPRPRGGRRADAVPRRARDKAAAQWAGSLEQSPASSDVGSQRTPRPGRAAAAT